MRWVELVHLVREMSLITFGYRVDYISYHGVVTADTRGATKYLWVVMITLSILW